MARSFGEPLTKLRAVPIEDNGEPLVDPRSLSKRIHFAEKHPKFEGMPRTPKVRNGSPKCWPKPPIACRTA